MSWPEGPPPLEELPPPTPTSPGEIIPPPDERPPLEELYPEPYPPLDETGDVPEIPSDFTYCPDHDAVFLAFMSLLPPGAAWDNVETSLERSSIIRQFMSALALSWLHFEDAMCVALDEWFCEFSTTDLDLWQMDYGIPDECDVYNANLCAKVAANGPPTAEFMIKLLEANGFEASGRWLNGDDPEFPGVRSTFYVLVDTSLSPAFKQDTVLNFMLGKGARLGDVTIGDLVCMLERYIPAHTVVEVEVAGSFTPATLGAKLLHWWCADDSANGDVSAWQDRIEAEDAFAGTVKPTSAIEADGFRWISFDGAATYLRTGSITVPSSAGSPTQVLALWNQLSQAGDVHVICARGSPTDFRRFGTRDQIGHQALNVAVSLSDQFTDSNDSTLLSGPVIGAAGFEEALLRGRVLGADTTPATQAVPAGSSAPTNSPITIGANSATTPAEHAYIKLRHLFITRGATPHEVRQLEGWMAWDIDKPDLLDGSHPYRNYRP